MIVMIVMIDDRDGEGEGEGDDGWLWDCFDSVDSSCSLVQNVID